ncbi:MAG: hypothetical protein HKP38_08065 [Croceitalea sp.]|nr:hypothetical protein [Croceitalea sp.]
MEEISTYYSWDGLLRLLLLLIAVYWALKFIAFIVKRFARRNVTNKKVGLFFDKMLIVYKPVAFVILLLDFISISYITHGMLLVILGVFGYQHIRNYISGLFFKTNPLVDTGVQITTYQYGGEIKKLLPFGLILNTEEGERYVDYQTVEKHGFSVNAAKDTTLRQTVYLHTPLQQNEILDKLFDNPILDFYQIPTLKATEEPETLRMQYTLEKGAATEDLIAFLNAHEIETSLTLSTD